MTTVCMQNFAIVHCAISEEIANIIYIVTDEEVTNENYFPEVGNIPRGRRTRGIFPTEGK